MRNFPLRELLINPQILDRIETKKLWRESSSGITQSLTYRRQKAQLLKLIRRTAAHHLTPKQKRYLQLIFFQGMTYRQAADICNVNPSTIHRGTARAIRTLKKLLEDHPETPPNWRTSNQSQRRPCK